MLPLGPQGGGNPSLPLQGSSDNTFPTSCLAFDVGFSRCQFLSFLGLRLISLSNLIFFLPPFPSFVLESLSISPPPSPLSLSLSLSRARALSLCLTIHFSGYLSIHLSVYPERERETELQWQVCHAKNKEEKKADLTTVLHIRELPHLHMKLAVWFSFPTTNNGNPMIPS